MRLIVLSKTHAWGRIARTRYETSPSAHTCALSLPDYDVFTRIPLKHPIKSAGKPLPSQCHVHAASRTAAGAETCDPRSFSFAEASETMRIRTCPAKPWGKQGGGARRDRTDDLMLAKHALYQLSYGPSSPRSRERSVRALSRRSNACPPKVPPSLKLRRMRPAKRRRREEGWWAQADSNCRPHAYQACALTT